MQRPPTSTSLRPATGPSPANASASVCKRARIERALPWKPARDEARLENVFSSCRAVILLPSTCGVVAAFSPSLTRGLSDHPALAATISILSAAELGCNGAERVTLPALLHSPADSMRHMHVSMIT